MFEENLNQTFVFVQACMDAYFGYHEIMHPRKFQNIVDLLLRIAFTKQLLEMASLNGKVDASDLLVLHEEVGTVTATRQGTLCAMAQVKLTAPSGKSSSVHVV